MKEFIPNKLPIKKDIETKEILKAVTAAHKALAELKGIANSLPNQKIVINTLVLQEAKDSSEIENIITTYDEIYRSDISDSFINNNIKEVQNYKDALYLGFEIIKTKKILTLNHIKEIQATLEQNDAGFRKQSGTVLKNPTTGEIKLIPPQNPQDIIDLMTNITEYINDDSLEDFDSLVKMAIIHYQFEAIHPFYDGNGRTGRIINILYLVLEGLLDVPILYLSRYIIKNKLDYYRLLNEVSFNDGLNNWILFMLMGIEEISKETILIIKNIEHLMNKTKDTILEKKPKIYSKDLLEALFYHPYTKRVFLEEQLNISRPTATSYLRELESMGILSSQKIGKEVFYIHNELFDLFKNM
ncbi:Fic family protein [Sulfurimonas sp.]|uniref:Fic family protein n=1 Tax=Sulfurimonas sp. TaxID=2022749 RepID=UPI00286E10D5|nr:Fic family protein [Sulfurimonas sp.]